MDEFVVEYESFFMDEEPEYDVFDIDEAYYMDLVVYLVSAYDTLVVSLDLKSLPNFLTYAFWVRMIFTYDHCF